MFILLFTIQTVPCLAFGFEDEKKGLKEEYKGLVGRELGALRKKGIAIEDIYYEKTFVYIGDTSERVFEMNPDLFNYKAIIVECTFLHEDDLDNADKTKHCHWLRLRPIIEAHPECMFILYHFSMRYKESEIADFFRENCELQNVHPWTH